MIVSVARTSGRSVPSVAREPYALTLWTFLQHEEAERINRFGEERDRIRLADMIAVAFHDPQKLSVFDRQLQAEMSRGSEASREELSARADRLWEQHSTAFKRREH